MTHTLHRVGSVESLKEDFVVVFLYSQGINRKGSAPKIRRFYEMALSNGAIKIGDAGQGNEYYQGGINRIVENASENSDCAHGVFKDAVSLTKMLRALKEADLGLSVVVSGLFDVVKECCRQAGLELHTINQSLGVWGRTEKLPRKEILEFNTMCGHGMVGEGLIEDVIENVKKGCCTPEEGAERLFRPCLCGIFNTHRATRLLRSIIEQKNRRFRINIVCESKAF